MPIERPHFDPVTCPLNGTTVVEAGAGTGKTYSITELYLRLLLEDDAPLTVEQILVVTYTNAATAELRNRLRRRLEDARAAAGALQTEDKVVQKLLTAGKSPNELLRHCTKALAVFDQAPIFTIHGFCQKMLNENAFESGIRYGKELRTDIAEMLEGFYYDFFRRNNYLASPERTRIWNVLKLTPQTLMDSTRNLLGHDKDQAIVWDEEGLPGKRDENEILRPLEIDLQQAMDTRDATYALHPTNKRKAEDVTARKEADDIFDKAKRAYTQTVYKLARRFVGQKLAEAKARENFLTFEDLLLGLRERLKDPQAGPRLREVIRNRFRYAIVDEFQDTDDIQNEIFQRLFRTEDSDKHRGFFMIGDPKQAIYGFRGGDIFTYLQATGTIIADRKPQLTTNYRSSVEFIQALNKLRGVTNDSAAFFRNAAIDFPEIRIPEEVSQQRHLLLDGASVKEPSHLLSRGVCDSEDALFQHLAEEIQTLVKNPRLRLQDPRRDDEKISYADIAVLVCSNGTGTRLAAYLRSQGIPCVQKYAQNIFGTQEAEAMLDLMETLQNLTNQPRINRFLSSCFFCLSPKDIVSLSHRENRFPQAMLELRQIWEKKSFLAMFRRFQRSSLRELLGQEAVQALSLDGTQTIAQAIIANGEIFGNQSSLACFQQLQENLHQTALDQRLGLGGLTEFLRKQLLNAKEPGHETTEENSLRLTTQDAAVTLMTIHKSKGLQFPIVFVVGIMNAKTTTSKGSKFHRKDTAGIFQAHYDMTSDGTSDAKLQADEEKFQELVRLFYVAITRAQYLCRVMDKKPTTRTPNPFFRQFFLPQEKADDASTVIDDEHLPLVSSEDQQDWMAYPPDDASPQLAAPVQAEVFDAEHTPMPAGWRTCSYSTLTVCKTAEKPATQPGSAIGQNAQEPPISSAEDERLDNEDNEPEDESQSTTVIQRAPIFRFPRGAQAGLCWHEILEKLDFTIPVEQQEPLYRSLLKTHAQLSQDDTEQQERLTAFTQMLEGLLNTCLPDPRNPEQSLTFSLKDIDFNHRSSELEFKYRLRQGFSSQALFENSTEIRLPAQWLREYRPESQWTLNGCLDLLFLGPDGKYYIGDWKTNSLNRTFEAFDRTGMQAEMDAHFYTLQYLLYTTAFLHAYQQLDHAWTMTPENYDRLFGGVFYFFVRGIRKGQSNTNGFYATRPSFDLAQRFFNHLTV